MGRDGLFNGKLLGWWCRLLTWAWLQRQPCYVVKLLVLRQFWEVMMSAEGSKQKEQTVTGKHAGTERVQWHYESSLETPRIPVVLELLQHHRLMSQEIEYLQLSSLNMQHCKLWELILPQSWSMCKLLIVLLIPCLSADSFAECYHPILHSCVFLSVNSVSCDHSSGTDHVENYFGRTGMSTGRS